MGMGPQPPTSIAVIPKRDQLQLVITAAAGPDPNPCDCWSHFIDHLLVIIVEQITCGNDFGLHSNVFFDVVLLSRPKLWRNLREVSNLGPPNCQLLIYGWQFGYLRLPKIVELGVGFASSYQSCWGGLPSNLLHQPGVSQNRESQKWLVYQLIIMINKLDDNWGPSN